MQSNPGLSNNDAWRMALLRARKRCSRSAVKSFKTIHHIFVRYLGTCGTSSSVESGLGRGQDLFHARRHCLSAAGEFDDIVIDLDGPSKVENLRREVLCYRGSA